MSSSADDRRTFRRNWVGFFLLGTLNNLFYVMVNSAGQSLCLHFGQEDWIGAILICNIAFGLLAKLLNMFFLQRTPFSLRVTSAASAFLVGLALVVTSLLLGGSFFWLCLLGITFVGSASSFGENVLLGYLRSFPAELVGAWSSGTGFAGVSGNLIYMLLISPWFRLKNSVIFGVTSPLIGLYLAIFFAWVRRPASAVLGSAGEKKNDDTVLAQDEEERRRLVLQGGDLESQGDDVRGVPERTQATRRASLRDSLRKTLRCLRNVWWPSANLVLVYLFEYVACTGGSDRALPEGWKQDPHWTVRNVYVVLNLCYQLGVLCSRSSLSLFKIRRVGVLTLLQGVNMVLWILQGRFHFVSGPSGVWVLFLHMFYVGLLGGASYVNVFYIVLHDEKIAVEDKEISVNIAGLSGTFGISTAALAIMVLDRTLWSLASSQHQAR